MREKKEREEGGGRVKKRKDLKREIFLFLSFFVTFIAKGSQSIKRKIHEREGIR